MIEADGAEVVPVGLAVKVAIGSIVVVLSAIEVAFNVLGAE